MLYPSANQWWKLQVEIYFFFIKDMKPQTKKHLRDSRDRDSGISNNN